MFGCWGFVPIAVPAAIFVGSRLGAAVLPDGSLADRALAGVVLFGALMGMLSSLLVYQLGQSRVWFSMSRDGLLPKLFSAVHPRFRTIHHWWTGR